MLHSKNVSHISAGVKYNPNKHEQKPAEQGISYYVQQNDNFIVITGANGSGKTKALVEYSKTIPEGEVVFLPSDSLFTDVTSPTVSGWLIYHKIDQNIDMIYDILIDRIWHVEGVPYRIPSRDLEQSELEIINKLEPIWQQKKNTPLFKDNLRGAIRKELYVKTPRELLQNVINDPLVLLVDLFNKYFSCIQQIGRDLEAKRDFLELYNNSFTNLSLQNFLEKIKEDDFYKKLIREYGAVQCRIREEFIDIVNKNLEEINYKYRIDFMNDEHQKIAWKWGDKLQNASEIKLSSGEKTMLGFVIWKYIAKDITEDTDIKIEYFILDEPDRHLDPKLCKQFLDIVQKVLVPSGMKVIMTTHRVDTVALVKPENIFQMCGTPGSQNIEPVHKLQAMFRMTSNLREITNYHHKVYTESLNDAYFYEGVYGSLKSYCSAKRAEIRQSPPDDNGNYDYNWYINGEPFRILSQRCQLSFYSTSNDGKSSGGRQAVIKLVQTDLNNIFDALTNKGVSTKWLFNEPSLYNSYGILDYDNGESSSALQKATGGVKFKEHVVMDLVKTNEYIKSRQKTNDELSDAIQALLVSYNLKHNFVSLFNDSKSNDSIQTRLMDDQVIDDIYHNFEPLKNSEFTELSENIRHEFIQKLKESIKEDLSIISKNLELADEMVKKFKQNIKIFNTRYTIENFILDPFIFCRTLDKEGRQEWTKKVLVKQNRMDLLGVSNKIAGYIDKGDFQLTELQNLINQYFSLIHSTISTQNKSANFLKNPTIVSVSILTDKPDSIKINYPEWFLKASGHDLVNNIFSEDKAKVLTSYISKQICQYGLKYIPLDLAQVFFDLNDQVIDNVRKVIGKEPTERANTHAASILFQNKVIEDFKSMEIESGFMGDYYSSSCEYYGYLVNL